MIFKIDVLLAWELNFHGFLFVCVLCVFGGHLGNSSFTCMGAQFWRKKKGSTLVTSRAPSLKKTGFRQPRFFMFFHYCWFFLEGLLAVFWRPFGVSVVSLACRCHPCGSLWLAWAVCGLSLLLFVVPLACLGCLWARGPLRVCFFGLFSRLVPCFCNCLFIC